jgi:hypothetical protein
MSVRVNLCGCGWRGPPRASCPVFCRDHEDLGRWLLELRVVGEIGDDLRQALFERGQACRAVGSARKKSRNSRLRRAVALLVARTCTLAARSPTGSANTSLGHCRPAVSSMWFHGSGRKRNPSSAKDGTIIASLRRGTRIWMSMQSLAPPLLDHHHRTGWLSPFVHRHIKVHGSCTFTTAELSRGLRALHDPDALAEDDG